MNEGAEGSFIAAVRVSGIEVRQTLAADRTQTALIERVGIHERSSASGAEEVSKEGSGESQAGGADRHS